MSTVREGIVHSINEINKVLPGLVGQEPEFSQLMLQRSRLQRQLVLVVSGILTGSQPEIDEAIASLAEVVAQAKQAQTEIAKTQALVEKAASSVAKVEKVIKGIREIV